MQTKAVFKAVGPSVMIIGIAMIACTIVSYLYQTNPWPLYLSGFLALFFGLLLSFFTRKADTNLLKIKEGCAIATLTWVFACFFGALPFYFMKLANPAFAISWTKSFFESVSGFTTTGASIFSNVEILPKDILFWRSLTHWFGGMGIVVLAVAILPKLGIGGLKAFRMESPGPLKSDKLVPRISQTAKMLYSVYLAVSVLIIISLKLVGVDWFDSLVHAFGTIGTGGFSSYNNSIAGLNNQAAEYIIAFFMWFSGANFTLAYLTFFKGKIKTYWQDSEFKVYTLITISTVLIITFGLFFKKYNNLSFADSFRYAFFQVPTIVTTTGYSTTDFNLWPAFPLIILVVLMFVGGSTGSTGGGLKVLRHIINFKVIKQELAKIFRPNLVSTVKVGGRPINETIVRSVIALTIIYLLAFGVGAIILAFVGLDLVSAVSASIASLGNIGPGLNAVGPASNYSDVHPVGLWTLSFLMLLGRLEIYTILILFIPEVWRKT